MDNNILKQRLLHTNTFAEGKLLIPREWSPGGGKSPRADGLAGGLKGTRWGNVRNVPLGSPFYEDSIVNKIIILKIKINYYNKEIDCFVSDEIKIRV